MRLRRLAIAPLWVAMLCCGCTHLNPARLWKGTQPAPNDSALQAESLGQASQDSRPSNEEVAKITSTLPGATSLPPKTRSLLALARLYEKRGEHDQARKLYQKVLDKAPDYAFALHRMGVVVASEGDYALAEDYLLRSLNSRVTVEALNDYGYLLYLQHRMQEAERPLRDALARDPNNPSVLNNLALVSAMQGRLDEGFKLFSRASTEAEAHANMAYVLGQQGDLAGAETAYLRALNIDSSLRPAAEGLLQIADRRSRLLNQWHQTEGRSAPDRPLPDGLQGSELNMVAQQNRMAIIAKRLDKYASSINGAPDAQVAGSSREPGSRVQPAIYDVQSKQANGGLAQSGLVQNSNLPGYSTAPANYSQPRPASTQPPSAWPGQNTNALPNLNPTVPPRMQFQTPQPGVGAQLNQQPAHDLRQAGPPGSGAAMQHQGNMPGASPHIQSSPGWPYNVHMAN